MTIFEAHRRRARGWDRLAVLVVAVLLGGCGQAARGPAGSSPSASATGPTAASSCHTPMGPAPAALGAPGWWTNRVFYEVFVRSFADSNGDGTGDLRGLVSKLDYLNDGNPATTSDLGITGLWLMPIMPSPSYHGYDVTDYEGVNPAYGSLSDLRTLVREAHRRGIAVILDMPFNHTSSRNPWFVDSRTPGSAHADWYVWANAPGGSNWFPDRGRYYYAAFGPDMPDLNLRNPAVTAELERIARFWIDDVGVDGFRLDAAKYLIEDGPTTENTPETHAWLATFRQNVEASAPGAFLLGEVWDTSATSASYVPSSLDMTFDFGLAGAYVAAANGGQAWGLARILGRVVGLYPPGGFGAFLTNHDMDRLANQVAEDASRMRLAAELLLTGPGVPFIYYGEEIGMSGAKPDPRIRTPMRWTADPSTAGFTTGVPWEPLSGDSPSVNVATESGSPGSLLDLYRHLIALRAANPALAEGSLSVATSSSGSVLATIRQAGGRTVIVAANLGADPVSNETVSLASGSLCPVAAARIVFDSAGPTGPVQAPTVTAAGGLAPYPLPPLPGRSTIVIDLSR